jgi:F0F1-type ATP synthase assembly protein I
VLGPDSGKQLKVFARIGALGIELALSTVLGLLGGRWLDSKLSTAPYLTVVGLLLGVTAGFRSLYKTARNQSQTPPHDHD